MRNGTWNWPSIFWRRFRNLDRVAVLTSELTTLNRHHLELDTAYQRVCADLAFQQKLAAAAESLATERLRVNERLEHEIVRLQELNERLISERLKSLDALNLKLLESRTEPPPPDLKQYRESLETAAMEAGSQAARRQMVGETRNIHRAMDTAILKKFYPQFGSNLEKRAPSGPIVNGPNGPGGPGTPDFASNLDLGSHI